MSKLITTCPHCGKVLSNPDKLGWHLSRECPALVAITTPNPESKSGAKSAEAGKG